MLTVQEQSNPKLARKLSEKSEKALWAFYSIIAYNAKAHDRRDILDKARPRRRAIAKK